jgi:hypothetical protein
VGPLPQLINMRRAYRAPPQDPRERDERREARDPLPLPLIFSLFNLFLFKIKGGEGELIIDPF